MLAWLRRLFAPLVEPDTGPEMDDMPESVRRARSMVGRGVYCLGAGGKDPAAPTPFSGCAHKEHRHHSAREIFSDCSGFVAWCCGFTRQHAESKWWRNTDGLEADARGDVPGDLGFEVPWAQAEPGDLLVYGAGPRIGHVGIVSESDDAGPVKVIHCSSSGRVAVKETGPEIFDRNHALVLRLR